MAEARERANWHRAATAIAWMGNFQGGQEGGKPFTPDMFDPFEQQEKARQQRERFLTLRARLEERKRRRAGQKGGGRG